MTRPINPEPGGDIRGHLGRLGGRYLLSAVNTSNAVIGGDVVDLLLLLSVKRAGRAALDEEEVRRLPGPLPDERRLHTRIGSLAETLDIPFETARRHVRRLRDRGLLESDAEGVRISSRALASSRFLTLVERTWRLASGLVLDAQGAGAPLPDPTSDLGDRRFYATRLSFDFIIDSFSLTHQELDLQVRDVLIFRAIKSASVEPLILDPALGLQYSRLNQPISDDLRTPTTVYNLAKTLMLPYETVRRHVWRLVAMGLVDNVDRGFVVPYRVTRKLGVRTATSSFARLSQTLIQKLAYSGAGPVGHTS